MTQRVVVIPYRRFGRTYRTHLHGLKILTLKARTERLDRQVGKELSLHAAPWPRRGQFSSTLWQKTEIWHFTTLDVRLNVKKKIKREFLHRFPFFAVQAERNVGGRQRDGLPLSGLKVTTCSWVSLYTQADEASRDINHGLSYTSNHKKVIFENKK